MPQNKKTRRHKRKAPRPWSPGAFLGRYMRLIFASQCIPPWRDTYGTPAKL